MDWSWEGGSWLSLVVGSGGSLSFCPVYRRSPLLSPGNRVGGLLASGGFKKAEHNFLSIWSPVTPSTFSKYFDITLNFKIVINFVSIYLFSCFFF